MDISRRLRDILKENYLWYLVYRRNISQTNEEGKVYSSHINYQERIFLASRFCTIAAGNVHFLRLLVDGKVIGWGDNYYGQISIPTIPEWKRVVQIAAGGHHSLFLLNDGTVVGCGNNTFNQSPPMIIPPSGKKYIQVAAGYNHSLGLLDDGTMIAFNTKCRIQPPPNEKIIQIGAGDYTSVGFLTNGAILLFNEVMCNSDGCCISGRKPYTQISVGYNIFGFQANENINLSGSTYFVQGFGINKWNRTHVSEVIRLRNDGTVIINSWGTLREQYIKPPGKKKIVEIAGGCTRYICLLDDGTLIEREYNKNDIERSICE